MERWSSKYVCLTFNSSKIRPKKNNVSSNFTFCSKMLLCIAVLYVEKSVNERFCLTMKSRAFNCTFDVLKLIPDPSYIVRKTIKRLLNLSA